MQKWYQKICIIILISIISIYVGINMHKFLKFLFWEETTPPNISSYDETFIHDSIVLKSSDLTEMQSEVLSHVLNEWKEVSELSSVYFYLNKELKLIGIVFVYQLRDVNDYDGRLEVQCDIEGKDWKITRAESMYYYDPDEFQNSGGEPLEDALLTHKIQAIAEFIEAKEAPRLELYNVHIYDDNVHIDAHNGENNKDIQNNWHEDCIMNQNGSCIE